MVNIQLDSPNVNFKNFYIGMYNSRRKNEFLKKDNSALDDLYLDIIEGEANSIQLSEEIINEIILFSKRKTKVTETIKSKILNHFKKLVADVCEIVGINEDVLKTKSRERDFVQYRQIIWALAHEKIYISHINIIHAQNIFAEYFNRDRTTVIYGIKDVEEIPSLNAEYKIIKEEYETIYPNLI